MRNYLIDDLTEENVKTIRKVLESKNMNGSMDDIYWLDLPESLYSSEQKDHAKECGPYSFGIEVLEDSLRMELLVRARSILRCSCVAYASPEQRSFAIDWVDTLLKEHDIPA